MTLKASVTNKGAVLLGEHVACDGFDEARPLRVVTHIHADHLLGLRQSLVNCEAVVMTPATKDLIDIMRSPLYLMRGNVKVLDYGETLAYDGERLSLHYADHIIGAAQALVEDSNGTRILYTGDFRIPRTIIVEADVLVMEATYGNASRVRSFPEEVDEVLVSLVRKGLRSGPVYIFGFHGKLQEVIQILHKAKVAVPFVVPERVFHFCKVCERHGMRFGRRLMLSQDERAQTMLRRGEPCVAFYHVKSRRYLAGTKGIRISVSGWEFREVCRRTSENEYTIALSDHSDFHGLLRYVEECRPKLVLTDNYRSGDAFALAKEIRKRFGIPAQPLPS
ncbi:MAG: exonuclease [Candidatus Bathyarchaeota archaeon]|nr:MAG: exonuclease [Candidatus Bathyarchaeota archaeon]